MFSLLHFFFQWSHFYYVLKLYLPVGWGFPFLKEKVYLHRRLGLVFAAIVLPRDNPELNRAGIGGTALVWSRTPAGWHLEDHQEFLRMSLGRADGKVHGLRGTLRHNRLILCWDSWSVPLFRTQSSPLPPAFLKSPSNVLVCITVPRHITFLFKTNSATWNLYKTGGGKGTKTLLPITCSLFSFLWERTAMHFSAKLPKPWNNQDWRARCGHTLSWGPARMDASVSGDNWIDLRRLSQTSEIYWLQKT